jgi:hypothetical protein
MPLCVAIALQVGSHYPGRRPSVRGTFTNSGRLLAPHHHCTHVSSIPHLVGKSLILDKDKSEWLVCLRRSAVAPLFMFPLPLVIADWTSISRSSSCTSKSSQKYHSLARHRYEGTSPSFIESYRSTPTTILNTSTSLFALVFPQTHDLVQHNAVFCRLDINTEVGRTQRLESNKSV